jgi:hypothetical protein
MEVAVPEKEEALRKALACEVHARTAPDELLRNKFRRLRDSWIRIANAAQMSGRQTTRNV